MCGRFFTKYFIGGIQVLFELDHEVGMHIIFSFGHDIYMAPTGALGDKKSLSRNLL